jgi:hypothetical protein
MTYDCREGLSLSNHAAHAISYLITDTHILVAATVRPAYNRVRLGHRLCREARQLESDYYGGLRFGFLRYVKSYQVRTVSRQR